VAKKKTARKPAKRSAPAAKRRRKTAPAQRKGAATKLAPVKGAELREVGNVRLEVGRAGEARVKRMVYPPGFRWSVDMKPIVGTALCMHAHVGFLVSGEPFFANPVVSCAHVGAAIMTRNTGTDTTRTIRRGKEVVISMPAPIVVPVTEALCGRVQPSKNWNTVEVGRSA